MTPLVSLRQALADPQLLGGELSGPSWHAWRSLLLAALGEELTTDEAKTFAVLTGRAEPPGQRVEELIVVAGRRGGKSRACAVMAVYVAALCRHELSPGERGLCMVIAPDMNQSRVVLDYIEAMFRGSPMLAKLVQTRTRDTVRLSNRIDLQVRSSSFRRLRGVTCVCVIADECAFWLGEDSQNPDKLIMASVRPALATTKGPLLVVSSPHARKGELWELFKRHYGPEGDRLILVAQAASRDLNPTLEQSVIDRALERDRAAASAEYLAQFRSDIESFVSVEAVEACVDRGVRERPPLASTRYNAFVDPSGGSSDSMTLAIAHGEGGDVAVLDCIREVKPPFSPESVVSEFGALLRSYRISTVSGDRFGGEFPRELFRKHGIAYEPSAKSKSDIYKDTLPLLNSGSVILLDNPRLVSQLCGLERRTSRGGRDSIDSAPRAHDDVANSACGALLAVAAPKVAHIEWGFMPSAVGVPGESILMTKPRERPVVYRAPDGGLKLKTVPVTER